MHSNKVNVLMPVYNTKESYLREAIESVLNQTYKNFDLIIVDDGSVNNAKKVIESYKDERIKFFPNEENLGIPKTRNRLLELADGDFIAFLDSDDIALPDRLEKQVAFLKENPEIGVVGSWFETFPKRRIIKNPTDSETIKKTMIFKHSVIGNSTAMIRHSVLLENNIRYDENYHSSEDYVFWLSLLEKTSFANIAEVLVNYRWHKTNISKAKGNIISLNSQKAMIEAQSKFFDIDATESIALIEKLKNGQKISSKELQTFHKFVETVMSKINESDMSSCDYEINRSFYKWAVKNCKKDLLFFKLIFGDLHKKLMDKA